MARLGVIGAGFVADHYMRSRATFPDLELVGAYDVSAERLEQFCKGWKVPPALSLDALFEATGEGGSF